MSQYVAQTPLAIPSSVEKAVVPSDEHTDDISVSGLREVEDW